MLILDVSNVNGAVNWEKVAHYGIKGAFGKASEGRTFKDGRFATNRAHAHANHIPFGAYHFARPENNHPVDEAHNFVDVVGKIHPGELRPVLDLEEGPGTAAWVRVFNAEVVKHLGVGPMFYSYPAYIEGMRLSRPLGYGLWLASYSRNDGRNHPYSVPAPWKHAVLHQFTSTGSIPGVSGHVDLSYAKSLLPLLAHPAQV